MAYSKLGSVLNKETKHQESPIVEALGRGIYKAVVVITNPTTKEVYIDPTGRGRLAAYVPSLAGTAIAPIFFQHASNTGSFGAPVKEGTVICVFFSDGGRASEGYWFALAQDVPDIVSGGVAGKAQSDGSGQGDGVFANVPSAKEPATTTGEMLKPAAEQKNSDRNKVTASQGTYSDLLRGSSTASPLRDATYDKPQQPKVTGFKTAGGSALTMDDGSISDTGEIHPEQIRITTASGAAIILDGGNDFIYVVNSSGSGWVEIGANGEVMVYAEGSLNMRTEKDFNLRADKNINLDAGENVNIRSAKNTKINANEELHLRSKGTQFLQSEAGMNIDVGVNCLVTTGGILHLNGPIAQKSELIIVGEMDDMQNSENTKLKETIVKAMPTHEPYLRPQAKDLWTSTHAIDTASDEGNTAAENTSMSLGELIRSRRSNSTKKED
jgi:hypothetical protein